MDSRLSLQQFSVKDKHINRETSPVVANDTITAITLGQHFRPFPVNAFVHRVKEPFSVCP